MQHVVIHDREGVSVCSPSLVAGSPAFLHFLHGKSKTGKLPGIEMSV